MYLSVSKMRAAVFYGPNKMEIKEVDLKLGQTETAIKVNACAVCGYDVRVFRNGHKKVKPPVILGHEICGEVVERISTPNGTLQPGTRIAVSPVIPCLSCRYCKAQQYNLCDNLQEIGSTVDGGFAEYIKIPQQIIKVGGLIPVPDNLTNDEAALLEPLACCLNGFSRFDKIDKEQNVLILGDGPIGLLHLQISKALYHSKTIVVGKVPFRMQKAKSMGADEVFLFDDKTEENIIDYTSGDGMNLIIVATNNPETLPFVKKVASKNSKINFFAGFSSDNTFEVDPNWLHYNQVSIFGSFSSTPELLRKAAKLASGGEIDLSKIVTEKCSLDQIKHAITATEKFQGLRTIVDKFC